MWRLLKGFLLSTAVMSCVEVTVLAAARVNYHDPFASYQTVILGQPTDAVKSITCQHPVYINTGTEDAFCNFQPGHVIFDGEVMINSNHPITAAVFIVEPDTLFVGDLVWCWGKPIYMIDNSQGVVPTLDIYWDNQVYARVINRESNTQIDYFLPVTALSIERRWRAIEYEKLRCASGQ